MKQQGKKVVLDLSIKPLQPKPETAPDKDSARVVVVTGI